MFKAQLYTNGSNSRDTFTSNDFFLVVMPLESTANWYLRLVNPEAQTRRYPDYRGVCVRGLKP